MGKWAFLQVKEIRYHELISELEMEVSRFFLFFFNLWTKRGHLLAVAILQTDMSEVPIFSSNIFPKTIVFLL